MEGIIDYDLSLENKNEIWPLEVPLAELYIFFQIRKNFKRAEQLLSIML
jgi:hypothetical protein